MMANDIDKGKEVEQKQGEATSGSVPTETNEWPRFDPQAPVDPEAPGAPPLDSTLAKEELERLREGVAPPEEGRWNIRLKWYYLLTAGLGVLTLFISLYGATEVQNAYSGAGGVRRQPSPLAFFLPFFGIGSLGVLVYLAIDALCAFRFRPRGSHRRIHFILNFLLYLAIVLGWPLAIAVLETFGRK